MDESPSEKLIILFQFVISTIGLVLNVPHLLILLHNSMRTSSTNSMMIGIAICDLIVSTENVYDRIQGYWFYGSQNPCMNQNNYWYLYSIQIEEFLQTVFERASFGLGLFLALTRLVIMKNARNTLKISEPLFGYILILILVGLSSVHSLYYYRIVKFFKISEKWKPKKKCTGYPAIYSEPRFIRTFESKEATLQIIFWYKMINGVFRILVSVAYPILTILLIFEIRKSTKFASKALNSRNYEGRNRTCRMILVMSIFFVIASAPAGFLEYLQLFVEIEYKPILYALQRCMTYVISALVCLNASSHGIINFTMSSKYRQTVKKCLGMEKQQKEIAVFVLVSKVSSPI